MTDTVHDLPTRSRRRSGRRKTEALDAAAIVIAERGADAARFVDVAAQSGVPVTARHFSATLGCRAMPPAAPNFSAEKSRRAKPGWLSSAL